MSEKKPIINYEDFAKLDLRVATVLEVTDHPNADKLICLKVDLGDEQRQILAGLKGFYTADDLVGKQIVVIANLAPRKMRGLESQGMLLAAVESDPEIRNIKVISPAGAVAAGTPVS